MKRTPYSTEVPKTPFLYPEKEKKANFYSGVRFRLFRYSGTEGRARPCLTRAGKR